VVSPPLGDSKAAVTITGVPPYLWRHGCGPTAVGMVTGYWDAKGFDTLIPGSAATQTAAVDQAIASGGDSLSPYPAGSEQHYEDYASPEDDYPSMQTDDAVEQGRTPHADNCLADFMRTSRSSANNYYGWSWSTDILPSFNGYAALRSSRYAPTGQTYYYGFSLTFTVLKQEIDAGRPMVFLVDSSGDGETDHFVTVIGYNDGTPQTYIYYNTWDLDAHEAQFRGMSSSYEWGVFAGWSFNLALVPDTTPPTGSVVINNNRSTTKTADVTLALTWSDGTGWGVARMRFSDDGATWSAWEPPAATRAYTLPAGDGYKTVRVQFLDKANNRSLVYNDYIRLDTTPPTGSILINSGASTTASQTVTLNLNWADTGAGVSRMRFSDNGSNWTVWQTLNAAPSHVLPAGPGYHTVRVQYADAAGNYSSVYSDYIKLVAP